MIIQKGDCLELMKSLSDKSVDMVLCDLPYGTTGNKWDNVIDFDKLWEQYRRVVKDRGAILLFGDEPFASALRASNKKMYRYDWYWMKNTVTGFLQAKKMPLKKYETISVFYKKAPTYNPQGIKKLSKPHKVDHYKFSSNYSGGQSDGYTQTYTNYPTNHLEGFKAEHGLHPTQKPVSLLEYLIKTYTHQGDLVLDNTMGSGSTGVACINLGRRFIGYEMDDKYFDIASERIQKAITDKASTLV